MKHFPAAGTLAFILLIGLFSGAPVLEGEDWVKLAAKALQSQLQQSLFEKFIRYDKQNNKVSFSPALMKMAADKARKSFGGNLKTFELKPEGNSLNFSVDLKNGPHLSANIEPEALELGPEEMSIVGRIPQGINVGNVDLPNTVLGFFDNLFGSSPSSSSANPSISPTAPSYNVTDVLKNFSIEGNTFRLKRPMQSSALGRALSSAMTTTTDGKISSISQRLPMSMENGWLSLTLGNFNPEKILLQFTMEHLLKQLQEK